MNFDDLAAFVHFSETLNFTRTAELLAISQPALHQKIQKLARHLETKLYVKERRRLWLTPEGQELAKFGRESLAHYHEFQTRIHSEPEFPTVTLMAGSGAYRYLLGPALKLFHQQGTTSLRLLTGDRDQTLEHLRTGKAQLGVTVLREPPAEFSSSLLRSVPALLVVPRKHRLARRKRISLKEVNGESLVVPSHPAPFRETLESKLHQEGVAWKLGVEAGGWELMMHFVALGLGLTVVNGCCQIPTDCRAVEISDLPSSDYYLLRPRQFRGSAATEILSEILRRTVAAGGIHQGEASMKRS